jgi:hypothetical protein
LGLGLPWRESSDRVIPLRERNILYSDQQAGGILLADINNDENDDVLLVNGHDMTLFLGNGDGTFGDRIHVRSATSGGLYGAALADFDEDGWIDLAVSHGAGGPRDVPLGPYWLRGDGSGRFADPVHLTPEFAGPGQAGTFIGRVLAADFNGDTHADIAVLSTFNGLSVFNGDGKGHFTPFSTAFPLAGEPLVADLNGDGRPDVAAPSLGVADRTGNFVKVTLLFNTTTPQSLTEGDADCDGVLRTEDIAELIRLLFGPPGFLACSGPDANADGSLTVADIAAMARALTR